MNQDFVDFLGALISADVQFLVVGAHALAVHGVPRATGDIDIWIERSPENARRVWRALEEFGAPSAALGLKPSDFEVPEVVIQIGLPPRRIDVLTGLSGIEFEQAWSSRIIHRVAELDVPVLGRAALIQNKRASARFKDLGDLEALGEDPRAE